jgi:hypothetical protein
VVTVTPTGVLLKWGDISGCQLKKAPPIFAEYNIYRDAGKGYLFIGNTAAASFLDTDVIDGVLLHYKVEGIMVNSKTKAITGIVTVLEGESVTVPLFPTSHNSLPPITPRNYRVRKGNKKLIHEWTPGPNVWNDNVLGLFVEDRVDGHAVAFVPAGSKCTGKWEQYISDTKRHCTRLRVVDNGLLTSEYTPWVCNSAGSICEGGTIGNDALMYKGIIYGTVTIGNDFTAGSINKTLGQAVVGWGAKIGDDVTFGKGVTVGDIAIIEDGQTVPAGTVIPYNGRVP